jgi:GNAT superfamily N-acetyltransferase
MNGVTLRPMTADEFDIWARDAIVSYAQDVSVATGEPLDVTLRQANEQFPRLLPNDLETASTWLMMIEDGEGEHVGAIWIGAHPANQSWAFVWDIKIDEPHRGRGFGRAAMLAAEQLAVDTDAQRSG